MEYKIKIPVFKYFLHLAAHESFRFSQSISNLLILLQVHVK
jgi:hypothetical protein